MKMNKSKKFKKHNNPSKAQVEERSEPKAVEALLDIRDRLVSITTISDETKLIFGPEIYEIAYLLKEDDDEWQAFCAHPDWSGERSRPKFRSAPRLNVLSFAIKFAIGAGRMSSGNRVSMFLRLLKPFWDEGTPPKSIAEKIRKQQEVKKHAAAEKRAKRSAGRLNLNCKPNGITKAINADEELQQEFACLAIIKFSAGVGPRREAILLTVATISVDAIRHLETGPEVPLHKS